jgi:hypothetical protein
MSCANEKSRLMRAARRQRPVSALKLFNFFDCDGARVSQFVFWNFGWARRVCDAHRMIPVVIQGDLCSGKPAGGTCAVTPLDNAL